MDQDRPSPSQTNTFAPDMSQDLSLGARLRAARLASGLSMAELSTKTRVHPRFLAAIEQGDQSVLPSRIFTTGYVRIYAQVLGLDELEAVEQFKRENPEAATQLQAPTGAAFQEMRRRSPAILAVVGVVIVAFLSWNIYQRLSRIDPPHPSDLVATPKSWRELTDTSGPEELLLNAPQAAPPDQSVPPMYLTRGIETELLGDDPEALATATPPSPPVQAAFNPRGALYGAPATSSIVVLQANRPVTLVIRQGDGRILFARQLAAGDSWRAPQNVQAVVDVSDPAAFDIYMNGEHAGVLTTNQTQLGSLNNRAAGLARASEARAAATAEAEARARAARAAEAAEAVRAAAASQQVVQTASVPAVSASPATVPPPAR